METDLWRHMAGNVGIFHPDEPPAPGRQVLSGHTSEAGLHLLVKPLCLAVGLWMVAGRDKQKALQNCATKCRLQSDTISLKDMVKQCLSRFFG